MNRLSALFLAALPFLGLYADDTASSVDAAAVSQRLIGIRAGLSAASDSVSALQASVSAASVDSSNDSGSDLSAIAQLLNDISGSIETLLTCVTLIEEEVYTIKEFESLISGSVSGMEYMVRVINESILSFQESVNNNIDIWGSEIASYTMSLPDIYSKCEELLGEARDLYYLVSSIEDILTGIRSRMDGVFKVDYSDDGTAAKFTENVNDALSNIMKALAELQLVVKASPYDQILGDVYNEVNRGVGEFGKLYDKVAAWYEGWVTAFMPGMSDYVFPGMAYIYDFYGKWEKVSSGSGYVPLVRIDFDRTDIDSVDVYYLDYANYRVGETNVAELVLGGIDASDDFFSTCAELLIQSLQVSAANGKTAYEILSLLRSDDIPGVEEEDKPDLTEDLTKLEDEYDDEDGWEARFKGITNALNKVSSNVQGGSAVNNLFGGLTPSAPNSISLRLPEYDWSFSGFEMHTQSTTLTAQIDGNTSQFFENCRAVAIFAWWVVAVLVHFFFLRLFVMLFKSNVVDRLDNILGGK